MSAVTALVSAIRSCGCQRDVPAALARAAQHPVPAQRRARRRRSAARLRWPSGEMPPIDVAGGAFGGRPVGHGGLRHAQRRGGGLQRQLRRHRQHRDGQPLGQRDHQRLEDCSGSTPSAAASSSTASSPNDSCAGRGGTAAPRVGRPAATRAAIAGVAARATGISVSRAGTRTPVVAVIESSVRPAAAIEKDVGRNL